jgi:tocopherol O-methyltransferase
MYKVSKKDIGEYYDHSQIFYSLFWSKDSLHYGIWDDSTKNLKEAISNSNKIVAKLLDVKKKDKILDAGCGVGGTSIYLAQKFDVEVHGITLSKTQLNIAKKKSNKLKVNHLLEFSKKDFTKTGFKKNKFSKIFGIESICHAEKKINFLIEAYRILEPGGRLVVADAFLKKSMLLSEDQEIYDNFLKGFAVPNLSTKDEFEKDLKIAGFQGIEFHDKTNSVEKSCKQISFLGKLLIPLYHFFKFFRIVPNLVLNNMYAVQTQKEMVDRDMVYYGIFVANKP